MIYGTHQRKSIEFVLRNTHKDDRLHIALLKLILLEKYRGSIAFTYAKLMHYFHTSEDSPLKALLSLHNS